MESNRELIREAIDAGLINGAVIKGNNTGDDLFRLLENPRAGRKEGFEPLLHAKCEEIKGENVGRIWEEFALTDKDGEFAVTLITLE